MLHMYVHVHVQSSCLPAARNFSSMNGDNYVKSRSKELHMIHVELWIVRSRGIKMSYIPIDSRFSSYLLHAHTNMSHYAFKGSTVHALRLFAAYYTAPTASSDFTLGLVTTS